MSPSKYWKNKKMSIDRTVEEVDESEDEEEAITNKIAEIQDEENQALKR